jgi:activator of HSP90 ATPase
VSRKAGGAFTAFGGELKGKNLLVIPNKMIVQTWRASGWKKSDPDSILVMPVQQNENRRAGRSGHVNVPEHDHQGVTDGWEHYYWQPWRDHLAGAEWKAEQRRKQKR